MATNAYLVRKILNSHIAVTILVTLTATLSIVINGIITGNMLGANELTAFGLATPVFILLSAIAGIFSNGGTIVCAKHMGREDYDKVSTNFSIVMIYSFLIGLIFTIASYFGADVFANLFNSSGNITALTADYIRGMSFSAIPFLLVQNLMLYLRMDRSQVLSLISMIVVVAVNTVFAYWFAGFTNMGLFGIGLAVTISNIAGVLVSLLYFFKKDRTLKLSLPRNSGKELKNICLAGLPTAINRGSNTVKNFILNAFLLSFAGNVAVLSLSVQTNVYQFLIAISTGYGIMISMMCSMFYGERDRRAMEDSLKTCLISGFTVSLIAGVILFIFAEFFASLFIKDGGSLTMAAECLRYFALSQPTSTVCLIFLYMYQSLGNYALSYIISVARGVVYVVAISLILTPVFGLGATWASFFLADVLSILTIIAYIAIKTKKFPRRISDFFLLKNDKFDFKTICDISIKNDMADVMNLADRMEKYFEGQGVPEDKVHRISLCIEEMAGNIVEHAFDDKKEHYIDIRVLMDDDLIVRIRDNGKQFNPMTANLEGHLGIKTVRTVAKSVDYNYRFNLNNLTVVV